MDKRKYNIYKKDCRSACDLRDYTDTASYMVTGANDPQQPIPEFLRGRIHSQPNLQRNESAHDTTMDTTLPVAETVAADLNSYKTLSIVLQMSC